MGRPENEKFDKAFWERKDGKPVSAEDAVKYRAKMLMGLRIQKIMDEAEAAQNAPAPKTEADKEAERIAYMKSRAPRHLGSEG